MYISIIISQGIIVLLLAMLRKDQNDVFSPNVFMDCASDNVVYLITCKKCGIQYVGETSRNLRRRFN